MQDANALTAHLDRLNPCDLVMAESVPAGDGSVGWAVNEAPWGSNIHIVRVKNLRVQSFSMLVLTT